MLLVEIQSLLSYEKSAKMWLEIYPENFIQFDSQTKKLAFWGGTFGHFGQIFSLLVRHQF